MKRIYGVIAAGALALASGSSPASAKLNSCDGPIVLGTTISVTGINSSLAGSWDKMTEMFEREVNKTGGVFLSSCNKKLPIKFVYYDDQSVAATAVSLYEKLATIDNVDFFVGPDWSTHGFPVSQVFEKYKIPSVMSNVATPKVYESGFKYIAGMALDADPQTLTWSNGAWVSGSDATQVKTIEDIALYAHGTGPLPPGVEGGLDAQTVYRD